MADEVKEKVTATEVKDFDFEAFLTELGKENPDMSVIKAGVEKFGTGKLSDKQKEQFLKTIMPERFAQGKEYAPLGLENMQGIVNTVTALDDLSRNGKLQPEQVKNVLLAENPHNKRNMVGTLALNARAGEIKLENMGKVEKRKENISKVEKTLKNNLDNAQLAMELLAGIDKNIVRDVVNTPDSSDKKFCVATLAKNGKSPILSKFMNDLGAEFVQPEQEIEKQPEQETEISGNESSTVEGTKDNSGLTVNAPKKETTDKTQTGNVATQVGKDRSHNEPYKFEKVKDQDIIQYMFEHWLLEIMTGVLKAPFWALDRMAVAADRKYDTSIPTSKKKDELPKNDKGIKFLNNAGSNAAENCEKALRAQAGYYGALFNTLKNNFDNKDFKAWKIKEYDGNPVFNVSDDFDLKKMAAYSQLLAGNSKDEVEQIFAGAEKQMGDNLTAFKGYVKVAGSIAASLYLANNIDGPYTTEAENRVRSDMLRYMGEFYNVSQIIYQRVESEYRVKNGLDMDKPLSAKDAAEVYKQGGKLFNKYMADITNDKNTLRDNLNSYYNSKNNDSLEVNRRSIEKSKSSLEKMFSPEYLQEFLDANAPQTKGQKQAPTKEVPILDFTRTEIDAEARDLAVNNAVNGNRRLIDSMISGNAERKKKFNDRVSKIKNKGRTVTRTVGNIFRKSGMEK